MNALQRFRDWLSPKEPIKRGGIVFGGLYREFGETWPYGWRIAFHVLLMGTWGFAIYLDPIPWEIWLYSLSLFGWVAVVIAENDPIKLFFERLRDLLVSRSFVTCFAIAAILAIVLHTPQVQQALNSYEINEVEHSLKPGMSFRQALEVVYHLGLYRHVVAYDRAANPAFGMIFVDHEPCGRFLDIVLQHSAFVHHHFRVTNGLWITVSPLSDGC